uniref:Wsv191-like protein n=1 Tax=Sicyonia whispovirus TaxID=2984283 RepID=A0A9C7BX06_9VIRU|nr:MAG: wsv191-like protein [Sicyonia whispovirus]
MCPLLRQTLVCLALVTSLACCELPPRENGEAAESICLGTDSKEQPLVFDDSRRRLVYPYRMCGNNSEGELFTGFRLHLACLGDSRGAFRPPAEYLDGRLPIRAACARINPAVVERQARLDGLSPTEAAAEAVGVGVTAGARVPRAEGTGCRAFRVGMRVPLSDNSSFFHTVYEFCWSDDDKHAIWVINPLNPLVTAMSVNRSQSLESLIDKGVRTKFRYVPSVFGGSETAEIYNPKPFFAVENQRTSGAVPELCQRDSFSRGHLAPSGDFVLASERWATFMLENVVPQWQTHNNGPWKAIEQRARSMVGGVLALTVPSFPPSDRLRYLDQKGARIPVPDKIAKFVFDKRGQVLYEAESPMRSSDTGCC